MSLQNSNSPKQTKVYWQSSTRDPENIDLDEIINSKEDSEPGNKQAVKTQLKETKTDVHRV
jgi:hypothetical protein